MAALWRPGFPKRHTAVRSRGYLGRVVRDFRVFRYEPDAETRLVHGRRARRVQKSGTSEQDRALAAVCRHFSDGHLVGDQTLRRTVYPTAARVPVAVKLSYRKCVRRVM